MAEVIQDWVNATMEDSQAQWAYIQAQELDDTFGWGAMTGTLLSRMGSRGGTPKEKSRNSCGLLLTGPEGCGKHTAAAHMMTKLWPYGYEMVFLSGMTLGPLGMARSIQYLEALLEACIEKDQALCIQLEDMENCPCRRELLTYLGQQLRNYRISDYPPLFLILIDGREQEVPACLRSQLLLCRMSLPTLNQRSAFLDTHAKDLRNTLSLKLFAQATEGASYAQLLDMICALNWLIDSKDLMALSDEELLEFLTGQMPVPTHEDSIQKLAVSAQHLVEQLPKLLKEAAAAIPVGGTVIAQPQQTQPVAPIPAAVANPNDFVGKRRQEIEEMAFADLAVDLFGQEGVDEIRSAAQAMRQ